jgi:hypothetical protein
MAGAAVTTGAVHHSDAGSQYTSVRFTETGSTGTAGDAHDNALAETTVTLQIRPSRNGHPDGSPFRDGEPHVKPGSRGREPGLTWGARGPPRAARRGSRRSAVAGRRPRPPGLLLAGALSVAPRRDRRQRRAVRASPPREADRPGRLVPARVTGRAHAGPAQQVSTPVMAGPLS